jgi:hypothetical protein
MRASGGPQSPQLQAQESLRACPKVIVNPATGSPPVRLIVATVSSFVLAEASVPCPRFV